MHNEINKDLTNLSPDIATHGEREFITLLNSNLPQEYLEYMNTFNGGGGPFGNPKKHLILWSAKDVVKLNPYYSGEQFSEDSIIIGSDGGGTLFGFNLRDRFFFESDVFEMTYETVKRCGHNFLSFLDYYYHKVL